MRPTLDRLCLVVVSLIALLGSAACSRAVQAGEGGPPVLTFTNESLDMTTVYAMRPGGDARRIASVMPGRTDTLRIPDAIANGGQVTIIAVPLTGSRVASSGPLSLGPGVRLAITLPPAQNILTVLPAPPM